MTEEELQQLEKLCAAATPGPWEAVQEYPDKDFAEETAVRSTSPEVELGGVVLGTMWYDGLHLVCSLDDSAFIAAARTALPRLIEEVRKNREALNNSQNPIPPNAPEGSHGVTYGERVRPTKVPEDFLRAVAQAGGRDSLIEAVRKNNRNNALKEAADICLSRTRYNYKRASEFTPGSEQYNFYAEQGDEAERCADLIMEHARRSGRFETTE